MNWLRPPRLTAGSHVALIAPSGPARSRDEVLKSKAALEDLGFRVHLGRAIHQRREYLAGTDAQRARDLDEALHNDRIEAIFALRGGYGCARILPDLDPQALRNTPKIICGFSDLTALHAWGGRKCQLATIHATTVASAFVHDGLTSSSKRLLIQLLTSSEPISSLAKSMNWSDPLVIRKGNARGKTVGGNLTVFASLIGTEYLPRPNGKILFLEDVNEEPYRLDRALTQLMLSGYLAAVEGVLLGQFTRCAPRKPARGTAQGVLCDRLRGLGVPVMGNLPIGHCRHSAPLPLGIDVEMDTAAGDVRMLRSFAR